jgi:uncharacterized protein
MAKAPRSGAVKTRLAPSLPASAVASLYGCLLQDTVTLAQSLKGVEVAVMCPKSDKDALDDFLGSGVQVVAQTGEGLAAGLTSVFRYFTATGPREVIAFNSDSPHLGADILEEAFRMLATHDVVVGPTDDGGYYLIGAKAAYPSLFAGDGMGTTSALERLLARTEQLGLSTIFSSAFYDIDLADDLLQLGQELQGAPERAPRTAEWFADWAETVAELRSLRKMP